MRLIDADALKYKQQVMYKKGDSDEVFAEWFITATEIDNAPTIDAVPVKHGRWEEKGTVTDEKAEVITEWQSARCTCCNKYHTTPYLYYFDNFAYCPNCGAKMDEEETNE